MTVMLKRITKIKNYRIFQDWTDTSGVEFKTVNVVYGVNGSGKSSLASLLADTHEDTTWITGLEVSVEDGQGNRQAVRSADASIWRNLFVFNRDYVVQNLRFDVDGDSSANPLLILGKQRIDRAERTVAINARMVEIDAESADAARARQKGERESRKLATDTATLIVQELGALGGRYAPRSYNAAQVKQMLQSKPAEPADANVGRDLEIVQSPAMAEVRPFSALPFEIARLAEAARDLASRQVSAAPIEALIAEPERGRWVQTGLSLHAPGDDCAFCGSTVTARRIEELERHFDASLRQLQSDAAAFLAKAAERQAGLTVLEQSLPPETAIDPSLRDEVKTARSEFLRQIQQVRDRLESLNMLVQARRDAPFSSVVFEDVDREPTVDGSPIAAVIQRHNELVSSTSSRRTQAAARVEANRVEAVRTKYEAAVELAGDNDSALQDLQTERTKLEVELRDLAQEELDATPLAASLTQDLARLLGRSDLSFELSDAGYSIRRGDQPALFLSEGEKTAISLLYFLKRLEAHDCDLLNAIVVIDDPVSSLDSNVVVGVSAHLWARLVGKDKCSQVFLLTHNFELFRSWSNQLDRLREDVRRQKGIDYTTAELRTRIEAADANGQATRRPFFLEWPTDRKMRNRLRSEYHYLFWRAASTLIECQRQPTPEAELDAAAILPNVCRRLLEANLGFKFPDKIGDFRALVEAAIGSIDNSVTRTRLVTFLNAYSHKEEGDITRPVERPESITMLASVFDLVRAVDPDHYAKMCTALAVQPDELLV